MKKTIYASDFIDAFEHAGRRNQFSYAGKQALYDYLTDMESCGVETELDVVAICCDFMEDSAEGIADDMGIELTGMDSLDDFMETLTENTWAAVTEEDIGDWKQSTVVYQRF